MRLVIALLVFASVSMAGTITAIGAVDALTDTTQIAGQIGTGGFEEVAPGNDLPGNTYAASGE